MRRKRRRRSVPAIRFPEEVAQLLDRVTRDTGWPMTTALAFLAQAGWHALAGDNSKVPAFRELLKATIEHKDSAAAASENRAPAPAKLGAAKKALASPSPAPATFPHSPASARTSGTVPVRR